jgi:hypothetical protein
VTTTTDTGTPRTAAGAAVPRGSWLAAGVLTAVLALVGGRYGFHRDELYFIEAGHHPAWGYPDQPPLVPLLAAGWDTLVGSRLWLFRLLPAVVAGAIVVVASLTARVMGATRTEQVWTAAATASCALLMGAGHLFSTTTFDIAATATTLLLLLHALQAPRERELRAWLWVGLAAGVTMQVKTLVGFAALAALAGLLAVGPREPLRRPGPYLAAVVAALLAAPNLVWQAANGWPQVEMGRQIAAGSSATSSDRWLVIPMQLLIVGPLLGVVLVAGLVALLRSPRWRPHRWVGVAYLVLLAIVIVTGGKPYYCAGLMLPLLAAGVPWVLGLAARSRGWRVAIVALVAVHVVGSALITLPLTTPASPVTAFANGPNPDQGETVGWDRFVEQVEPTASVTLVAGYDGNWAVLTRNYGEAGALSRYRRSAQEPMPPVYSGHNAYGEWGPPPEAVRRVVVVGWFETSELLRWFETCRDVRRIDNGVGLENEEQGAPVRICEAPRRPWSQLWPEVRHLG